jgi:uncharacterized protein YndB with AHSA1/START domain
MTGEPAVPDRIEKEILIRAPRARVWRALADRTEFGTWFRVAFPAGAFAPGEKVVGQITYPGYEHMRMEIEVVDVVPDSRLSFLWYPYDVDPDADHSAEAQTVVTFTLDDADGGTRVRVVESGFDRVPLHRRAEAFRMNEGGWVEQMGNIERHVTASP